MSSILLTVAYNGRHFAGFAPQRDQRTVSQVLRDAILTMDPGASTLRAASRTDSGVHARGQRVAFDTVRDIPPRGWVLGLNAQLPSDVAVRSCKLVAPAFDPRDHSRGKRYRYRVRVDAVRDPLLDDRSWRVDPPFDLEKLATEAADLVGRFDFRAFRSSSDPRTDTVRTLTKVSAERVLGATEREGGVGCNPAFMFDVVVEGSAFLHNMVRIIVGTLVDVARGRLRPGAVSRALSSGRREDLGITAPAHGLLLDEVFLEDGAEPLRPEGPPWP